MAWKPLLFFSLFSIKETLANAFRRADGLHHTSYTNLQWLKGEMIHSFIRSVYGLLVSERLIWAMRNVLNGNLKSLDSSLSGTDMVFTLGHS